MISQYFCFIFQILYALFFVNQLLFVFYTSLLFLFFVNPRYFIYKHLPFDCLTLFNQLLIDSHHGDHEIFFVFALIGAFFDNVIEADRVHVERLLNSQGLVLSQPLLANETLVIKTVPQSRRSTVFDDLSFLHAWICNVVDLLVHVRLSLL